YVADQQIGQCLGHAHELLRAALCRRHLFAFDAQADGHGVLQISLIVHDKQPLRHAVSRPLCCPPLVRAALPREFSPSDTGTPLNGSFTVKVAPRPTPGLSALTVPPCISARWRTMANPSPRPPCVRASEPSA